jgi:hypothetical protein
MDASMGYGTEVERRKGERRRFRAVMCCYAALPSAWWHSNSLDIVVIFSDVVFADTGEIFADRLYFRAGKRFRRAMGAEGWVKGDVIEFDARIDEEPQERLDGTFFYRLVFPTKVKAVSMVKPRPYPDLKSAIKADIHLRK